MAPSIAPSATTGVGGEGPGLRHIELPVSGMTCEKCVQAVERALRVVPGVARATVNLAGGRAFVEYDPAETTLPALHEAIKSAGYRCDTSKARFGIKGITCGSCVTKIERTLRDTLGVLSASVSVGTEEVVVEYLPGVADLAQIKEAVGSAGYKVMDAPPPAGSDALDRETTEREREYRTLMRKWWFGAAVGVFTMVMSYPWIFPILGRWFARGSPQLWYVWAAMGVASLTVLVYSGNQFFTGAWDALKHRSANMHTLIALGTGVAWIYSTIALLFPQIFPASEFTEVYYDVTVVVTALVVLGLAMELKAKGRTSEAIKKLIGLQAKTARVVRGETARGRDSSCGVLAEGARRVRVRLPDGDVPGEADRGGLSMRLYRVASLVIGSLLAAVFLTTGHAQLAGRWTVAAPMPDERTEVAVAEVGGKVYVVGGFGGRQALLEYDPVTDRWRQRGALPQPLHHTTATAVGGRLYVVGGYAWGWSPVDTVLEYDPAQDRWRERAKMPTARGALAAGVLDGKIHVVGGVGPTGRNTGAHEAYDPVADRWTRRALLPSPRDHLAAGVVGGRLYAIGGRIDGSYARNLQVNEEYDPQSDRWRPRAPLPTARSGIAAAVLGGKVFVFGGEATTGTFNQVEAYDPSTDTWTTWSPMPTARHGLGAASVSGRIFVVSGGPRPGGSYSALNEVLTP